jgi:hypothetical protein
MPADVLVINQAPLPAVLARVSMAEAQARAKV